MSRPATLEDLRRVMEPFKGAGKSAIICGYARDRLRWPPSFPELAEALGFASITVRRHYDEWLGYLPETREYWAVQIDGALMRKGLEVGK